MTKPRVKGQGNPLHSWWDHNKCLFAGRAEELESAMQSDTSSHFHTFELLIIGPAEMAVVVTNGEEQEDIGPGVRETSLWERLLKLLAVKMTQFKGTW